MAPVLLFWYFKMYDSLLEISFNGANDATNSPQAAVLDSNLQGVPEAFHLEAAAFG